MKKFATLLAASALLVSSAAMAEDMVLAQADSNPNDVIQTVPSQSNDNMKIADTTDAAQPAADAAMDKKDAAAKPAKAMHKKKHSNCAHGCKAKKHHHKAKHAKKPTAVTPADASAPAAEPAAQ